MGGGFPESWRVAAVILVPGWRWGSSGLACCRPVVPTGCLCKAMEHVADRGLVWFLESSRLVTGSQCEFGRWRSTIGYVVQLETSIREVSI